MLLLPPEPVVFGLNPVGQLIITNDADGVRLLVKVSAPVTTDIMVFGQAPCSRGRTKRRNVSYLGLLPAPHNGLSEITDLYIARFGQPPPLTQLFIVTRQQQNGWEDNDLVTHAVVPENPAAQPVIPAPTPSGAQAIAPENPVVQPATSAPNPESQPASLAEKPAAQQAGTTSVLSLKPYMHKGCTPSAQGMGKGEEIGISQVQARVGPGGKATMAELGGGGGRIRESLAERRFPNRLNVLTKPLARCKPVWKPALRQSTKDSRMRTGVGRSEWRVAHQLSRETSLPGHSNSHFGLVGRARHSVRAAGDTVPDARRARSDAPYLSWQRQNENCCPGRGSCYCLMR